jgi:hypothetical protein
MMVHPRDNELVVGTHGRSVFVADVKPLQALKDGGLNKAVMAFAVSDLRFSERWGVKQYEWSKRNEPSSAFFYYVGKPAATVKAEIFDEKNNQVRTLEGSGEVGFQSIAWDVKIKTIAPPAKGKSKSPAPANEEMKYAGKGKYKLKLINGNETSEVSFEVK